MFTANNKEANHCQCDRSVLKCKWYGNIHRMMSEVGLDKCNERQSGKGWTSDDNRLDYWESKLVIIWE